MQGESRTLLMDLAEASELQREQESRKTYHGWFGH